MILDGCRYDLFSEVNWISGVLLAKISRGSSTEEFLDENFRRHPDHKRFEDVVYVSANPYVNNVFLPGKFLKIYPVWDRGWDSGVNTVRPESVVECALAAHEEHPSKRLIVHFMQPHEPFLGTTLSRETGFREHRKAVLERREKFKDLTVWDLLERGELALEEVWAAYRKNLELVLPHVKKLLDTLPGKTVVTADHGNLFGERVHFLYPFRVYGHPAELHVRELVLIPWLIVNERQDAHSLS